MSHRMFLRVLLPLVLLHAFPLTGQQAGFAVPRLVNFSGTAIDSQGKPIPGVSTVTCAIYKDEAGGPVLWTETQNVLSDAQGKFTVQLGATVPEGLALDLFSSGESRWLGVRVNGGIERPRVLLLSVPYALKAADAETVGGLPPSAFVLANSKTTAPAAVSDGITPDTTTPVTTGGGTANYIPQFTGASTIGDSIIYATGNSVGIGDVPNPAVKLDVNGSMLMRGPMTVSRTGNATTAKGFPSYGFDFFSNAYNSTSKTNDNPYFQLQSEPTGNNTSSPSATFNLLFANNGGAIAETGFYINPNGTIHFAPAQTFPGGPGLGTITGVTAGTDLTGGGTSGVVTLNLNTGATDGRYARLAAANNFTSSGTFAGPITGNSGGTTYAIQGNTSSGYGVQGYASGVNGVGAGGYSTGTSGIGVYGNATGGGEPYPIGVLGHVVSGTAVKGVLDDSLNGQSAVLGQSNGASSVYNVFEGDGLAAGVWGDAANHTGLVPMGVAGTSDNGYGGVFENHSDTFETLFVFNGGNGGTGLPTAVGRSTTDPKSGGGLFSTMMVGNPNGTCGIGGGGDLTCTGQIKSVVPTASGARQVETYAMQSPENWMEDFGSDQLQRGSRAVTLDPAFAETVTQSADYHVFLTPNGESNGLYITNKTATGFEVHESGHGASSVAFDYRIVAKRRGFEAQRLTDVTERFNAETKMRNRTGHQLPPKR